jgi:hypothetical protein
MFFQAAAKEDSDKKREERERETLQRRIKLIVDIVQKCQKAMLDSFLCVR